MTIVARLQDLTGRLVIGGGLHDGPLGNAPLVTDRGRVVGVYLDDTTPDLARWVLLAAEKYHRGGRVFVGCASGTPSQRFTEPGVVNMQEWYPFGQPGVPWRAWGLPPKCEGYIIQKDFAWPGGVPPRKWQFRLLLWQVRLRRPKYIWTY